MRQKFNHSVSVGLGETKLGAPQYMDRVNDAFQWFSNMGLERDKDWRIAHISGNELARFEFLDAKTALLFKVTFG